MRSLRTIWLLVTLLGACPQPSQYPPVPPKPTNPTNAGPIAKAEARAFPPAEVIDASIVSEGGGRSFDASAFVLDGSMR
jgi:hypothetical protein